jgi:ATP-dependent Lhr-like helicase
MEAARRLLRVRIAGQERWSVVEDSGRLRDALGVPLPVGVPEAFTAPVADPVGDLVSRYARTHVPFAAGSVAHRLGVGVAVVTDALRRLERAGRVVSGELLPAEARRAVGEPAGGATDWCDAGVLRVLRRRSLAALRAEVEPVPQRDLAAFLPAWQGVGAGVRAGSRVGLRGVDGVARVVEQLAGAVLPASGLESLVLPDRVDGYTPALLDELTAAGEVVWAGHGALPGDDGWVSLHPADTAPLTLPAPDETLELTSLHRSVLDTLAGGGAYFFRALSDAVGSTDDAALATALWDLLWAGHLTNDTLAPLRARLFGGRTAHRPRRPVPRARYRRTRLATALPGGRAALPTRQGPPTVAGRWSLLPPVDPDPTVRAHAAAEVLLDRYGVLTRGSVTAERLIGGFGAVYRVLAAMEDAGRARRGYFVEGLGASQFATSGAVDRLRASARPVGEQHVAGKDGAGTVVLAAADPANPYGAALGWPEREGTGGQAMASGHRPGRKAGALVVLSDGELVIYVERGGRSLLSFSDDPVRLQAAADALALAVREGALGRLTVQRADGEGVLAGDHPLAAALESAGFHATPRGLRLRA